MDFYQGPLSRPSREASQLREKRTVNRKSVDVTRNRSSEGRTCMTGRAPIGHWAEVLLLQDDADMRSAQPPRRCERRPHGFAVGPDIGSPDQGRIWVQDPRASLLRS